VAAVRHGQPRLHGRWQDDHDHARLEQKIHQDERRGVGGHVGQVLGVAADRVYTRFEGNLDCVATHRKRFGCYTLDGVYGLSDYSTAFVTDKNLTTEPFVCRTSA
jgi:hypothetical protein